MKTPTLKMNNRGLQSIVEGSNMVTSHGMKEILQHSPFQYNSLLIVARSERVRIRGMAHLPIIHDVTNCILAFSDGRKDYVDHKLCNENRSETRWVLCLHTKDKVTGSDNSNLQTSGVILIRVSQGHLNDNYA